MILFPAIDIIDGKVVRLRQGDYDALTRYGEDPIAQAQQFAEQGAEWLHVVDLDAAKAGQAVNRAVIAAIAKQTALKVQIGGGIRSLDMARAYFDDGVARVVVGTRAAEHPEFLSSLGSTFPGRIALGLDTKQGKIATHGWTQTLDITIQDFLAKAPLSGIACLIFTDIARDGMLSGPNLPALQEALQASELSVIASGGISSLADIQNLVDLEDCKLLGVIVGKALYEGKFTLAEALKVSRS